MSGINEEESHLREKTDSDSSLDSDTELRRDVKKLSGL